MKAASRQEERQAGTGSKLEKCGWKPKTKVSMGLRGKKGLCWVARQKRGGSGESMRSGLSWRGVQRKRRGPGLRLEWKSSNCFDLELSRGVTQSKRVMNSTPSALLWEQSHSSPGFLFMGTLRENHEKQTIPVERHLGGQVTSLSGENVKWKERTGGDA